MKDNTLKGKRIYNMLSTFACQLNLEGYQAYFNVSQRNVPYISVMIGRDRFNIAFFGKYQTFRVFKNFIKIADLGTNGGTLEQKKDEVKSLLGSITHKNSC